MGCKNMEHKIKVGDRVVAVGVVDGKDINGKTGIVRRVWKNPSGVPYGTWVKFDDNIDGWEDSVYSIPTGHGWSCGPDDLRRIADAPSAPSPAWSIHITPKGNATHAVFKQGKHLTGHASATCSPHDTYDATTGAAWAFLRLPGMADAARRVLAEMDGAEEPKTKRGLTAEECKPGMRVRFRQWADMEKERGLAETGSINGDVRFTVAMKPLCGTCATIEDSIGSRVILTKFESAGHTYWNYEPWMIELAVVTDEPAPVPQPMYRPGDRVRIVEKWGHFCGESPNGKMDKWLGKIMTVREKREDAFRNFLYKMEEDRADNGANDGWYWFPAAIAGKVGESRGEK